MNLNCRQGYYTKPHKIGLIYYAVIYAVIVIFSLFNFSYIVFAQENIVKIKDDKGEIAIVSNLKADYSATGSWFPGHLPKKTAEIIGFKVHFKEGRITTEKYIKIPFKEITFIKKLGRAKLEITLNDSSKIIYDGHGSAGGKLSIFGHGSFQQSDSNGTTQQCSDNAQISIGNIKGEEITLDGFSGDSRTTKGIIGKYSIPLDEISILDFQ